MNPYINPGISDFQDYFVRDFNYGTDPTTVMGIDITNAMQDAANTINPSICPNQQFYTVAFLLLAAHFLVMSLRASSQGITGQFNFVQGGKGAGPANESFVVPAEMQSNAVMNILSKTHYGVKYYFYIKPYLTAPIFSVCGQTQP